MPLVTLLWCLLHPLDVPLVELMHGGTPVCKSAVLVFFLVLALPTRLILLFIACTLTVGCVYSSSVNA